MIYSGLPGHDYQGADRGKGGEPPVTSILLSTDMYTLIGQGAIVPPTTTSRRRTTRRGSRLLPAFAENSQAGARPGAFRSALDYRPTVTRKRSKARLDRASRRQLEGNGRELRNKLTKRDASGRVTRWGVRFRRRASVLAVQGSPSRPAPVS
jgi:sn-glycerol 3-phosphate transport system substrate-binding protein